MLNIKLKQHGNTDRNVQLIFTVVDVEVRLNDSVIIPGMQKDQSIHMKI